MIIDVRLHGTTGWSLAPKERSSRPAPVPRYSQCRDPGPRVSPPQTPVAPDPFPAGGTLGTVDSSVRTGDLSRVDVPRNEETKESPKNFPEKKISPPLDPSLKVEKN